MCKFTLHLCQLREQNKPLAGGELGPQLGRFSSGFEVFLGVSPIALEKASGSAGVPSNNRLHHRLENLPAVRAAQSRVACPVRVRH
jgi:hypothetical protein